MDMVNSPAGRVTVQKKLLKAPLWSANKKQVMNRMNPGILKRITFVKDGYINEYRSNYFIQIDGFIYVK